MTTPIGLKSGVVIGWCWSLVWKGHRDEAVDVDGDGKDSHVLDGWHRQDVSCSKREEAAVFGAFDGAVGWIDLAVAEGNRWFVRASIFDREDVGAGTNYSHPDSGDGDLERSRLVEIGRCAETMRCHRCARCRRACTVA